MCGDCGFLIVEGLNAARWSGAALQGSKRAKMHASTPLLDDGWVQDTLSAAVCQNRAYDESIIRNEVDKIQVLDTYVLISRTDGSQDKRLFQND